LDDIERQFTAAQRTIDDQIRSWYGRFATNNQIDLAEARRWLTGKELAEFKWDVTEYICYGKEAMIDPSYMRQLENASAKFHVSRLEALKIQTQNTMEVLFGNQLDSVDNLMKQQYLNGYYHTMFEVQKGFNVGWDIAAVNDGKLERILSKPWTPDKKTFSDRIWTDKERLLNNVHTNLTHNMILGKSPDHAINNLANAMGTSKYNAGRLIMTESAYFSTLAQKDAFNELDVEQFEVIETLDSRTCAICGAMDGQVFPMSEYQAGTTAPPFHPFCRGTTVPYFDDDIGERAARDPETGETHYVPSDMKYTEWKASYVDNTTPPRTESNIYLKKDDESDIIRESPDLKLSDFPPEFSQGAEKKITQRFNDYINGLQNPDPNSVELLASMGKMENFKANGIPFKISHGANHAVQMSYNPYTGDLREVKLIIPKLIGDNITGQVNTAIHEKFHLIDLMNRTDPTKAKGWFSESSASFKTAFEKSRTGISQEVQDLFAAHKTAHTKTWVDVDAVYKMGVTEAMRVFNENSQTIGWTKAAKIRQTELTRLKKVRVETADYLNRNLMGGGVGNLQDIYDALSAGVYRDKGTVIYGHGSKYYKNDIGSQLHETLANYGALSVTRPDLVEMLRRDKPDLVRELDKLIAAMLGR
jgi:SPP1 gp7 family putative phage head morphogenesis protein